MIVVLRTVEVVLEIDEETNTSRTEELHGRDEGAIRCPFAHGVVAAKKDLLVTGDEKTTCQ